MTHTINTPWASGPGELLKHGLKLLQKDSDSNRRIAMICIDNSVELMMKTFLGLPSRISKIKISRNDYSEICESFPKLLDAIEKYAVDRIKGIDLGEIEWFHRLRNELYHQGNGLTVERNNAEVYAEIANLLFLNLFGFKLIDDKNDKTDLLGKFMNAWINFEITAKNMAFIGDDDEKTKIPLDVIRFLHKKNKISLTEYNRLNSIRQTRNEIVHGLKNHDKILTEELVNEIVELSNKLVKRTTTDI